MEKLPEMFAILQPGYRYLYVALCKNTIRTRKRKAPFIASIATTQRYSLVNIDCNTLEYLPTRGRRYDALVREESANSSHDQKYCSIAWHQDQNATPHCYDVNYHYLPFALYYDGNRYPIISLRCGRLADYKFILTEDDKQSILLLYPEYIPRDERNEGVPAILQDDEKEPESVPNIPNKLPTFVIENHMHCEIARSECAIASIGLNECDRVSMLDCYHVFDSASIHAWMRIKAECPVCKGKSQIIHTLSVPESLRPPAAPKKLPKPGIAPAAPKKLPKPGIAPSAPK
jgi:hypothetical protein